MAERRNVIVIYTDQQRADSLGCMGNALARTPNLDALAACGTLYRRHYAANPVCMPSRASFHTGCYPQAHRVIDNGIFLPPAPPTVAELFRQGGYRTHSIGKLHFQPYKPVEPDTSPESMGRWERHELDDWTGPYYGFETCELTLLHGEMVTGHYGRWRERHFPQEKLGLANAQGQERHPEFICWKSNVPAELHHTTWVGDRAVEFLQREGRGGKPFFLHVSFPDPHHPFTPPAPYSTMFDGVTFPGPHAVAGENEAKPLPWRRAMTGDPFPADGGARFRQELAGAYQQIYSHTYGMIAHIDDAVGRVLEALRAAGLEGETLVVFSSDHGDFLGDHHLIYKGQLPCRSLLNIPLIVADPALPADVSDAVTSNVDVAPTLLDRCGLAIPEHVQGVTLPEPGRPARRAYAFEAGWSKASPDYHHYSLYQQEWRITVFPYLRDGELYDLRTDPWEHRNLFHDAEHASIRDQLLTELLYAVGRAEPKKPPVLTDW